VPKILMQPELASDLKNHFLVAMPGMADPNFHGSVVYIADHSEKGALGLLINRPMDLDLGALFERIELSLAGTDIGASPVLFGGPVQTDRGFVLHRPVGNWSSSLRVTDEVALTSSKDVLEAVAAGTGPEQLLVTLGYAGWGPGQLEDEIAHNAWLTAPADAQLLFDVPVDKRLARAFALLGIDPAFLSSEAGHA
jgi:putative transcriptional regulator